MSRTSGLLTAGTLALAATFSIGVEHTVNAATSKPAPKACALLTTADFAKAGVSVKVGPPEDNPGGALSAGGSACGWSVSTAKADFPIELSYGRSLKQRPELQFFADLTEPISGLPAGSVYVEAHSGAARDAYNGFVVKRGTLVVTLKATLAVVPKKAMLMLAKTIDARVK